MAQDLLLLRPTSTTAMLPVRPALLQHTTTYNYPNIQGDAAPAPALPHPTNSPHTVTDPAGVVTTNIYDNNFRKTSSALANNPAAAFDYDAAGDLTDVTDPRGGGTINAAYNTHTTYDGRNRKTSVDDPINPSTKFQNSDGINFM